MKRIISVMFALLAITLVLFSSVSCGEEQNERAIGGGSRTLYVYNWGEYISENL